MLKYYGYHGQSMLYRSIGVEHLNQKTGTAIIKTSGAYSTAIRTVIALIAEDLEGQEIHMQVIHESRTLKGCERFMAQVVK